MPSLWVLAIRDGTLRAEVSVVLSNKAQAGILERACTYGIPARHIPYSSTLAGRTEYDQLLTAELEGHGVDLVLLIGYMRLLSKEFVERWRDRYL